MSEPDIVQRIQAHIASFQRSKVRLGAPKPVVAAVARVGDPIKHKSFWAAVAGAVVGATVSAAPYILCGFLGPLGAAARMAMMISDSLDALDNDTQKNPLGQIKQEKQQKILLMNALMTPTALSSKVARMFLSMVNP